MRSVYIRSTGAYIPEDIIDNNQLVNAFNEHLKKNSSNEQNLLDKFSDPAFILKASGIQKRHVIDKTGILDVERMYPNFAARSDDSLSLHAEFALKAIHDALNKSNMHSKEIDAVICACSNHQRPYPAIAIEIQNALEISGFGFDMNVACSSATFAISQAVSLIQSGTCNTVLVANPEICSGHMDFTDRDSHFIFGDAATAIILSANKNKNSQNIEIKSCLQETIFSNNIRNNMGFLRHCELPNNTSLKQEFFKQNGRKVFKEVVPLVCNHIVKHCDKHYCNASDLNKLWLHQANSNMNQLIAKKLLGENYPVDKTPSILEEYANTGSAGSILAYHFNHEDLKPGAMGILCSFGAGYSVGSIFVSCTDQI